MDRKIRSTFVIPAIHYKMGLKWAWLKGRPIATLASDVFQARVENKENVAWIERNMAARAADLGLSVEELEAHILNEAKFDSANTPLKKKRARD